MWHATGEAVAKAPSLAEIRKGSFGSNGWEEEGQRRNSMNTEQGRRSLSGRNPTTASRDQTGTLVSPAANTGFDDIQEDSDGFPDIDLGRGEMSNQSYVRGPKKAAPPIDLDEDLDDAPVRPGNSKRLEEILGEDPPLQSVPEVTDEKTVERPDEKTAERLGPNADGVYPNGYKYPPKHTWGQATVIGLKAFWKFTLTPLGFLIVLYGLNVVAWGGMLFLLLCGAAPKMCYPAKLHGIKDCNNIDAPRRIWIETDSQILNALFCVTGFGLAPWRFRDLYFLLKYRIGKDQNALRKLAGIHRGWFRLPGSDRLPPDLKLTAADITPGNRSSIMKTPDPTSTVPIDPAIEQNPALALPISLSPDPPLTGVRAPPTPLWKLDYVIWAYVLNTFLQCVLSGFMWGLNRYNRPSWSTGTFVALACIVAALGGLMAFLEGKKVKNVEGIPIEVEEVVMDVERGEQKEKRREGH